MPSENPIGDALKKAKAGFESLSPEDRIRTMLSIASGNETNASSEETFTTKFTKSVKLNSVQRTSDNTCIATFEFTVEAFYLNPSKSLHGAAQAAIFDVLTSLALQSVAKKGPWYNAGVSRTLTVNYLRPAPEGELLLCECEVVQAGKRLAMTRGLMKRARDGAVISTCEHNKSAAEKPNFKL